MLKSRRRVKRLMDIVIAAILLIVFGPIMAAISLAILATAGRPVLFRQRRPGLHGIPFMMWKFRTMRAPRDDEEMWTTDELRVTRLGALLRSTSLDELPELVHVLTGQMSLVGPRPLLVEYLDRYSQKHARRHDVKPGITGLAQVSGRRELTFGQRLELDIEYVERWSIRLDIAILFRTLTVPFRGSDIPGQSVASVDDVHLFTSATSGTE